MSQLYIFIDPFNSEISGVTNYINEASKRIEVLENNKIKVRTIGIMPNEDLNDFKKRVYAELKNTNYFQVEFPESMGLSCDFNDQSRVHVRLHCGKTLGKYLQQLKFKVQDYENERLAIIKANKVSAPSEVAKRYSFEFYKISREVFVYPNPIFPLNYNTEKDIDVIFLGRMQYLKGTKFLENISKKIKYKIHILTKSDVKDKRFNILKYNHIHEKNYFLSRAKVVIVPSLFDIFSMVSLEALACKAHVVAWEHIGLLEYVDEQFISRVPLWNIDKFADCIEKNVKGFEMKSTEQTISRLNKEFDDKFSKLLNSEYIKSANSKLISYIPLDQLISSMPIRNINDTKKNIILRKVRKFINDPNLFWEDSSIRKKIFKKHNFKDDLVEDKSVVDNVHVEDDIIRKRLEVVDQGKKTVSKKIEPSAVDGLIGTIDLSKSGMVKINALDLPRPKNHEIIFFYHDENYLLRLKSILVQHHDFSPFKKENFRCVRIENLHAIQQYSNAVDILNRFDLKTKEYISLYKNIVFIDLPNIIFSAFKFIGYNHRITVIHTGEKIDCHDKLINVDADTYIRNESLGNLDTNSVKKYFNYKNIQELSFYLRKVVQDNGPKDKDMLIPIFDGMNTIYDVNEMNSDIYQGFLILNERYKYDNSEFENFDDYLEKISIYVDDILLRESVYLTYKNLCDKIKDVSDIKILLGFLTKDGVYLDVKA